MPKNKAAEIIISVTNFINAVKDETKRKDSHSLIDIIKKQTGLEPKMWGPSIVGFGSYHYKYDSGHEGDSPLVGFSPRVSAITLYFSGDFEERHHLRPSGFSPAYTLLHKKQSVKPRRRKGSAS